jgi:hypothetical protein
MTLQKSMKPAAVAAVNGLQEVDRLAGLIGRASRSIPVYVRRSELLWSAANGGVA